MGLILKFEFKGFGDGSFGSFMVMVLRGCR